VSIRLLYGSIIENSILAERLSILSYEFCFMSPFQKPRPFQLFLKVNFSPQLMVKLSVLLTFFIKENLFK
ncbi:MAG: hypothetical protein ACI97P_003023, partial [Arcticibacterium sp.]